MMPGPVLKGLRASYVHEKCVPDWLEAAGGSPSPSLGGIRNDVDVGNANRATDASKPLLHGKPPDKLSVEAEAALACRLLEDGDDPNDCALSLGQRCGEAGVCCRARSGGKLSSVHGGAGGGWLLGDRAGLSPVRLAANGLKAHGGGSRVRETL